MTVKRAIVGFAFEGVGLDTADSEGICLYAAHHAAPTSSTDYEWINALTAPPSSISTEVNPYTGDWSISSFNVEIARSDRFMELFFGAASVSTGEISGLTGAAVTTVDVGLSGKAGEVVWVGDEAILLGSSGGGTSYTGCTRAYWGTTAQTHLDGAEVFERIPYWETRTVTLVEHDLDTGTETTRWRGVVRDIDTTEDGSRIVVVCDEYLQAISRAQINRNAPNLRRQTTIVEGLIASVGILINDYTPRVLDGVSSASAHYQVGEEYIVANSTLTAAQKSLRLDGPGLYGGLPPTGEDVLSPDLPIYEIATLDTFADLDPYERHPLAIALALLVSGSGSSSFYGVLGDDWGLGIDWIDEQAWIDEIEATSSLQIDQLVLGWNGAEVDVLAVVQERLLRPFGYFLAITDEGELTLGRLRLLELPDWQDAQDNSATVYVDGPLQWLSGLGTSAKEVVARVGELPWREGRKVQLRKSTRSNRRALLGDSRTYEIDYSTLRPDRLQVTSREDSDLANALVSLLQLGLDTVPQVRVRVSDYLQSSNLDTMDLGAIIRLASLETEEGWAVDSTGTVATDTSTVEFAGMIIGREWSIEDHSYTLTLLLLSYRVGQFVRLRAPSGVVGSYDAGPPATITLKQDLFGEAADPADVFTDLDEIQIIQRDGTQADAEVLTIDAIGSGTTIELVSAPTRTPIEDDIVRIARSDDFENDTLYSVTIRPFAYLAPDDLDFTDGDADTVDADIYGTRVYGGSG